MKLVKNANKLHKMRSVQLAVLSAVVGLQEVLPVWESIVPENVFAITGAVLATVAAIARSIDQGLGSDE